MSLIFSREQSHISANMDMFLTIRKCVVCSPAVPGNRIKTALRLHEVFRAHGIGTFNVSYGDSLYHLRRLPSTVYSNTVGMEILSQLGFYQYASFQ